MGKVHVKCWNDGTGMESSLSLVLCKLICQISVPACPDISFTLSQILVEFLFRFAYPLRYQCELFNFEMGMAKRNYHQSEKMPG